MNCKYTAIDIPPFLYKLRIWVTLRYSWRRQIDASNESVARRLIEEPFDLAVFIQDNHVSRSSVATSRRRIGEKSSARERASLPKVSFAQRGMVRGASLRLPASLPQSAAKSKLSTKLSPRSRIEFARAKFPIPAFMRGAAVQFSSRLYCKRFD